MTPEILRRSPAAPTSTTTTSLYGKLLSRARLLRELSNGGDDDGHNSNQHPTGPRVDRSRSRPRSA
eukprot:10569872-Alexandrium_andersonii.AAC.1